MDATSSGQQIAIGPGAFGNESADWFGSFIDKDRKLVRVTASCDAVRAAEERLSSTSGGWRDGLDLEAQRSCVSQELYLMREEGWPFERIPAPSVFYP